VCRVLATKKRGRPSTKHATAQKQRQYESNQQRKVEEEALAKDLQSTISQREACKEAGTPRSTFQNRENVLFTLEDEGLCKLSHILLIVATKRSRIFCTRIF
jgi:hypothetical protein